MPSSSTRDTKGEKELILAYQHIYMRYQICGYKDGANYTTQVFEALLDWGPDSKFRLISNLFIEREWRMKWEEFIESKKTSENMWAAADWLGEAAFTLHVRGRESEAAGLQQFIEDTQKLAREHEWDEKNWSDNSDYYHHGG